MPHPNRRQRNFTNMKTTWCRTTTYQSGLKSSYGWSDAGAMARKIKAGQASDTSLSGPFLRAVEPLPLPSTVLSGEDVRSLRDLLPGYLNALGEPKNRDDFDDLPVEYQSGDCFVDANMVEYYSRHLIKLSFLEDVGMVDGLVVRLFASVMVVPDIHGSLFIHVKSFVELLLSGTPMPPLSPPRDPAPPGCAGCCC